MAPQVPVNLDLGRILRAVRTHLGMDIGFISEFLDGRRVFRYVEAAEGKACIEVGGSDPLEDSYCYWIAKGELAQLICDPLEHPIAAAMPVTRALPVGAHLSVPIKLRDGRTFGTFCCFSFVPDQSLNARDLATIEAFAQIAADQIQDMIDSQDDQAVKTERVRSLIDNDRLNLVFQPAFYAGSGHIAFFEALSRFDGEGEEPPSYWFGMAGEVGLSVALELCALMRAIEAIERISPRASVSFNASPSLILSPEFADRLAHRPLGNFIVEITEHEVVSHYSELNEALAPLRKRGLRVAVDDMGAGYSSLRHILEIKPDIIKFDMSLVHDIDNDPAKRALVAALVSFSHETGSEIVAEGVEREGELKMLQSLGADIVQGFFLGAPTALGPSRR